MDRLEQKIQMDMDNIQTPVMIWVDNYQVYQARAAAYVDKNLWRNSKMTAMGAFITVYSAEAAIDFSLVYTPEPEHKVIPGIITY